MYGGLGGMEGYGAGGAGCMMVLVGWRSLVLEVLCVWWFWWDGGVWCRGSRVNGRRGGMEWSGAGGMWWS